MTSTASRHPPCRPLRRALAWEPVERANVKVVKKWGATTGTVFEPGAHLVNPVSQSTASARFSGSTTIAIDWQLPTAIVSATRC
ncbi:hypothetical protein C9J85_19260 [Haloferax sp. wsp5]|nr:hypothetical protein C9J85_19260 [Haloferax sp. wsp5]